MAAVNARRRASVMLGVSKVKRFQKSLFDVLFSGTVLLLGLPMLVAIGLAVTLTSPGPAFYRQKCIGLGGRPFMMLKFRTAVDIHGDPRVTPLGRFLRMYRLDELPQFINVLKRDMSIVGPRPLPDGESATRLLQVRPGIAGDRPTPR